MFFVPKNSRPQKLSIRARISGISWQRYERYKQTFHVCTKLKIAQQLLTSATHTAAVHHGKVHRAVTFTAVQPVAILAPVSRIGVLLFTAMGPDV